MEAKALGDFIQSIKTLVDRVTQYLHWWESRPKHHGYQNKKDSHIIFSLNLLQKNFFRELEFFWFLIQ